MKKWLLVFCLFTFAVVYAQDSQKKAQKKETSKYNDNVDDRMKGPKGEKVYIGPNGGRYYMKDGKKVYVEYNGNKKKKTS